MSGLELLRQDLRFGARNLARTPGVTAIAVLSVALGIMATTAIYSVIHGVIVDPFPYRDVDRLMSVRGATSARRVAGPAIRRTSSWRSRSAARSSKE